MNSVRTIICCTALVWSLSRGQEFRIVHPPTRLPLPFASSARISPTGDRISFTGKGFNKLYIADVEGRHVQELCSHDAVGWGHQWSPDGKFIAVRANQNEAPTKRVRLELLDVENGTEIAVTDFLPSRSRLSLPSWKDTNLLAYSSRSGLELKKIEWKDSALTLTNIPRQDVALARWSTDALEIIEGAKVQRVRPFRQARQVLNAVWTSDRRFSAVEFSGRPSLYVVSADGKTTTLIDAKGESPCWLDDHTIVYMVTEDDGYRILSGNIWVSDREGKVKKNLTEGLGEVALFPSAAKNGTVVFTTESGAVYTITISRR
jgi:Tol biopolymer transport system component